MKLYELIESENTGGQFERWAGYRGALTSLLDEIITEDSKTPTLAIWGAGSCCDINIGRLSSKAKLVLIDCEKSRAQKAIEKYGLDKTKAIAADLFFYDIPYERYEQWEELLCEGAVTGVLHEFLSELLLEAVSSDMLTLPQFDYSVAAGIFSQLNSRLAALFYSYRENYSAEDRADVLRHIALMDRKAADRLYDVLKRTTEKKIVFGYEDSIFETGELLNIEGNRELLRLISSEDKSSIYNKEELCWPFVEGKSYGMKFICCKGGKYHYNSCF